MTKSYQVTGRPDWRVITRKEWESAGREEEEAAVLQQLVKDPPISNPPAIQASSGL